MFERIKSLFKKENKLVYYIDRNNIPPDGWFEAFGDSIEIRYK